MRINIRIVALAAAVVIGLPATASAQYGYPGYGGGIGGYPGFGGGYPGLGGLGGLGGFGNQQQIQQLAPQNLRNNWYMYDSIGGMGRTGGTVQIVTQFGLQSQQGAQGGGGFGGGYGGGYGGYGGGIGGFPAYYGVNYQRQLAAAMAYQQAVNAYRYQQMMAAQTPAPSTGSTASYSSFTPAATPKFGGFGFANNTTGRTGFGAFNPQSFDVKKDELKDKDSKETEKVDN